MTKPQCSICEHPVVSGKCWICNDCRANPELKLGAGSFNELPNWAQFLVRKERARRRLKVVIEIAFSDLCYCDRLKVQAAIGESESED